MEKKKRNPRYAPPSEREKKASAHLAKGGESLARRKGRKKKKGTILREKKHGGVGKKTKRNLASPFSREMKGGSYLRKGEDRALLRERTILTFRKKKKKKTYNRSVTGGQAERESKRKGERDGSANLRRRGKREKREFLTKPSPIKEGKFFQKGGPPSMQGKEEKKKKKMHPREGGGSFNQRELEQKISLLPRKEEKKKKKGN